MDFEKEKKKKIYFQFALENIFSCMLYCEKIITLRTT
jgi:hypothetical protein